MQTSLTDLLEQMFFFSFEEQLCNNFKKSEISLFKLFGLNGICPLFDSLEPDVLNLRLEKMFYSILCLVLLF